MTRYLPSLTLLALCALATLGRPASLDGSPTAPLLYHFTHANALHLLANAAALIAFRPRWATIATAYLAATLAGALYQLLPHELPACGLSGLICAAFARRYAAYNTSPWPFLLWQVPIAALFPNFSLIIHLTSFIIAYLLWNIYYTKTNGR